MSVLVLYLTIAMVIAALAALGYMQDDEEDIPWHKAAWIIFIMSVLWLPAAVIAVIEARREKR